MDHTSPLLPSLHQLVTHHLCRPALHLPAHPMDNSASHHLPSPLLLSTFVNGITSFPKAIKLEICVSSYILAYSPLSASNKLKNCSEIHFFLSIPTAIAWTYSSSPPLRPSVIAFQLVMSTLPQLCLNCLNKMKIWSCPFLNWKSPKISLVLSRDVKNRCLQRLGTQRM